LFDQALAAAPELIAARVLRADAAGHVVFDFASARVAESTPGEAQAALDSLRQEYDLAWQYAQPGKQRDILDVERSLFDDDWTGLRARLERALQPGDCPSSNWITELAQAMGFQAQLLVTLSQRLRCDPYQPLTNFHLAFTLVWSGQAQAAIQAVENAEARGIQFDWLGDARAFAALALGEFDHPSLVSQQGFSLFRYPRDILRLAAAGDIETAKPLAEAFYDDPETDEWSSLMPAAMLGDRERANAIAARIDARTGGTLVLINAIGMCTCGAPFDLDATPNFQRKIEQAGFDWPPPSPINWPLKDW
jgi:hypothetical protein